MPAIYIVGTALFGETLNMLVSACASSAARRRRACGLTVSLPPCCYAPRGAVHYILTLPFMLSVVTIYSFCNMHDITWWSKDGARQRCARRGCEGPQRARWCRPSRAAGNAVDEHKRPKLDASGKRIAAGGGVDDDVDAPPQPKRKRKTREQLAASAAATLVSYGKGAGPFSPAKASPAGARMFGNLKARSAASAAGRVWCCLPMTTY